MQEYQKRVVKEHLELSEKVSKLTSFLDSDKVRRLDPNEYDLLLRQNEAMFLYLTILAERIARF